MDATEGKILETAKKICTEASSRSGQMLAGGIGYPGLSEHLDPFVFLVFPFTFLPAVFIVVDGIADVEADHRRFPPAQDIIFKCVTGDGHLSSPSLEKIHAVDRKRELVLDNALSDRGIGHEKAFSFSLRGDGGASEHPR